MTTHYPDEQHRQEGLPYPELGPNDMINRFHDWDWDPHADLSDEKSEREGFSE